MDRDISTDCDEELDRDVSPGTPGGSCRGLFAVEELISRVPVVPKGSLGWLRCPPSSGCHRDVLPPLSPGKRWEKGAGREKQKGRESTAGVRRRGKAAAWPLLAPRVKIPGTLCTLGASAATAKNPHRMQINHCVRSTPEEHPAQGAAARGADSLPSDRQR